MSLDLSNVEPADIILTMDDTAISRGIRIASCGPVSHAILVLKNGNCIDATGESGVRIQLLKNVLEDTKSATLYRHKWITSDKARLVCHHAQIMQGREYDTFGAIRSGVESGCSFAKKTIGGAAIVLAHIIAQKGKYDDRFFCSELVAYAFEKCGIPITDQPFHTITPRAIAYSTKLGQVEVLKA